MTVTTLMMNFKDNTRLIKWLKVLLYIAIFFAGISIVFGIYEYDFIANIQKGQFSPEEEWVMQAGESNDFRQEIIGLLEILRSLVTAFLFLMWIYRANGNAQILTEHKMRFTKTWSVIWYFIPILNIWKPFQVLKEIWTVDSRAKVEEEELKSPPILGLWWFLWLCSFTLDNISLRYALKAEEMPEILRATLVSIAADVLAIPLCIVTIILITKFHTLQMAHFKRLNHV